MKLKVKKSELKESIKNAVLRVLSESELFERGFDWDDDDDDDAVSRFLKDPKNDPKGGKKRMAGGGAAKAAAMKDIEAELKAAEKDDKAIEDNERKEREAKARLDSLSEE